MKNDKHQKTFLKDYAPSSFLIEATELEFILDPKETVVNAKLWIKHNHEAKTQEPSLKLNGANLNLETIKLNGGSLSTSCYHLTPEDLTILQVPDDFVLATSVKIQPEQNLALSGLYMTDGNFCTQNEPHGFRHITYFIDRPDILSKFTTTIIADKDNYPVLLSNGNLIAKDNLPSNRHFVTWQDPFPKSAYLFALVAGKYGWIEDCYLTNSNRKITLRIFADSKLLDQCSYAMSSLKQAMSWEERTFGLTYDLDMYQIVAVNDFNFGAMENKGLNIFNSNLLLASPNTTTDDYYNRITAVIAHEYFHNWTGNRVTCRDWFQIGLKEGLTTLREQLFMEDITGFVVNRIDSIEFMRTKQFAEDAGPLSHPIQLQSYIEVNNFYTPTVYEKSAEVARMLYTLFGKTVFQQIMQDFLHQFDGKPATIDDFLQVATLVTKTDLQQFSLWFKQPGTPTLTISDDWDHDKVYYLKIKQNHPKISKDFYLPCVVGLIAQSGKEVKTQTLVIDKNEQTFSFANLPTKPVPSLLRGFSSPVNIEYSYSYEDLLMLIIRDQDPVNRWDASQKLMANIAERLYQSLQTQEPLQLPPILISAFKTIITDKKIDPALAAQMLQLPTENYLIATLSPILVENLHQVREFMKLELANKLKAEILACYENNIEAKPYSVDALAMGKRKLKNLCLNYLMQLNTSEMFALCLRQLTQADNMTDIQACLVAIANSNYAEKEQLLEAYYQEWHEQPNLVNQWLQLNATIKLPGTLERVKKLTLHPAFNIKNPNKVRALIRSFSENNHVNFHLANGEGYRFLADQVLAIDKFNPQLAASIVVVLTHGHMLEPKQQELMQRQLIRISQEPGLSKNVYEIVNKAST